MDFVIDSAFVLAATQLFKNLLGVDGKIAFGLAFVVALAVGFLPLVVASFPAAQAYVTQLLYVVKIFIAATGTYQFVRPA